MLELKQVEDENPICPHCSKPISELCFQELRSSLGRRYIYFCSDCKKVMGVSHRKGFLMG